ncbi:MAG: hypothetical protein ACOX4I_06560 [Anaerovoracaceae bacterium]|jgi:hypothetical protein
MSKSKKLIIFSIAAGLVLVIGVFLFVSSGSKQEEHYTRLSASDQVYGTWATDSSARKGDSAELTFKEKGAVSGQVSGYGFKGSCKKLENGTYVIFNRKGKAAYKFKIDGDDMSLGSAAAAHSSRWELQKE